MSAAPNSVFQDSDFYLGWIWRRITPWVVDTKESKGRKGIVVERAFEWEGKK